MTHAFVGRIRRRRILLGNREFRISPTGQSPMAKIQQYIGESIVEFCQLAKILIVVGECMNIYWRNYSVPLPSIIQFTEQWNVLSLNASFSNCKDFENYIGEIRVTQATKLTKSNKSFCCNKFQSAALTKNEYIFDL